ncbi:hypothetical protein BDB00DRAFT_843295 [Zychaea mexicana]|uniref:uncharacterized protein n=1 Tax=Zychaea mexicana TaxID=64656 RepID=UPI0022FF244D|nr:uncharacterized protein BDB00DRAFT_843295 [Zychaea mexicana]KAI9489412.1 hypothetical protein BDB00DRAFT_843295 [Zychaea mexicana]
MMTPEPHPQHIILRQQHQQQLRKKKPYPPSIPAATLWATADYPLAKRRMPVAPLIRLSGIDRLPPQQQLHHLQQQLYPERRPQTPPPAYTGTLPPRYEDISHYSDDDEPLARIQQRRKTLGDVTGFDRRGVQKGASHNDNKNSNSSSSSSSSSDESSDEYETLDQVQQRLKSAGAYGLTKQ